MHSTCTSHVTCACMRTSTPTCHGAVWSRASSPQQPISPQTTSPQQQSPDGSKSPLRTQLRRSMTKRRNAVPLILSQEMVNRARTTVAAEDLTRRRREHSARLAQWKRMGEERIRWADIDGCMIIDRWIDRCRSVQRCCVARDVEMCYGYAPGWQSYIHRTCASISVHLTSQAGGARRYDGGGARAAYPPGHSLADERAAQDPATGQQKDSLLTPRHPSLPQNVTTDITTDTLLVRLPFPPQRAPRHSHPPPRPHPRPRPRPH